MPTVRALIALYLRHSAVIELHCPAAMEDRTATLGLFAESYGDIPAADCKPFHLTDFIEGRTSWRSAATRRGKASSVRACFAWAFEEERIPRNPFKSVRYVEAERRPDMPDEILERVQRLANKRFEVAIRFLRLTACRLSELSRAEWPDMDLERGIWTIHRHKSRKSTGRPKLVALVPEAVSLLHALRAETPPGYQGTVFLNNRGTAWNRITLGQHLRRMKRRHGIETPATLHGIRHRFGSCAIAAGAPLKLVSAQMGHATTAVTERYYVDLSGEIEALRAAAQLGQPR